MKLIIDIPEEEYNHIKRTNEYSIAHTGYIYDGIPLEQIRDEIKQIADEEQKHDEKWAVGLRYAVKIIDNFTGDKK